MTTIRLIPPSCSSITNMGKAVISVIPFCGQLGRYVPAAGEAAINYVEEQVTSVVDEVTNELTDLAIFLLFLVIMLIIIPVLIFLVWVAFTIKLPNRYLLLGIIFVLILTAVMAFVVYRSLRQEVVGELNSAVDDLSDFFANDANTAAVTNIINGAAGQYLAATL